MSRTVVDRLYRAANDHDVDAIVACFAPGYRNETPAHPQRGFTGREQVRRNWTTILAAVPDLRARLLRVVADVDEVWVETEHRGTRPDRSAHHMRGVIIFGVADDLIVSARFYLEPVETGGPDINAAVREQLGQAGAR